MNCKTYPKCSAKWMSVDGENWQHYWATGAVGSEEDLAGLVCNKLGDDQCINPKRGDVSGDSWAKRDEFATKQQKEWDEAQDR